MTRVSMNHGSEGPRHDPYSYEEIRVTRPDDTVVTMHVGLAVFCDVRMRNGMQETTDDPALAHGLFERYAGVTPEIAARAYRQMHDRRITRHACGTRHIEEVDGYPGETFLICGKCKEVLDSRFNASAVE